MSRSLRSGVIAVLLASPCMTQATPLLEAAKLTSSDGVAFDLFGNAAAISGDTVVVGAHWADVGANEEQGAVYVFEKPASGWASMTQVAKLTASDGAVQDHFGVAVAISGDTIVVGAWMADVFATNQGAAYVFEKPASGWADMTETAKLRHTLGARDDHFGEAVAIDGDTIVVGCHNRDIFANPDQGAVYVFEKPATGWTDTTESAWLLASDGAPLDELGLRVAIDGDTVVAGAWYADIGTNPDQGAAYVFERPGPAWSVTTESAKLTASDGGPDYWFSTAVGVSGDTVVVGARQGIVVQNKSLGAAYVFEEPQSGWTDMTETAKLGISDDPFSEGLGNSAAIDGDTILVGASTEEVGGSPFQGAAYVFEKPPSGWVSTTTATRLLASDGGAGDVFGTSVGISGDTAIVGSDRTSVTGQALGAVYVFDPPVTAPGSGCGAGVVTLAGSRRIGTGLTLTSDPCAPGSAHAFLFGVPLGVPFQFSPAQSCAGVSPCLLSCNPVVAAPGTLLPLTWPNNPALVGGSLCVQAACIEPTGCVATTDMVTVTLSS